ncbi:hypothetical protein PHLGIDRAFT_12864 [Phlebiopsis gigantea 11061_1 CR5-6]|uniref:Uncharacterized protein n=1 Tax=Phlebiopsis gigantea (strain 11061_1 CR5-6) TaxID=745531 RepID=A0A0C3S934_PHLG1|nr:hypothetical protein PHLGIDRAFT_12864 [Phlebiopsis gigantea 11061_1 CR5-6]
MSSSVPPPLLSFVDRVGYSDYSNHAVFSCQRLQLSLAILTYVIWAQAALFSALRVYAMWSQSKTLFAIVFLIGIIPIVADLARLSRANNIFAGPPFDLCISSSMMSNRTLNALETLTRSSAIAGDVLVLVLTWIRTYGQMTEIMHFGQTWPLSARLIRDGSMYFAIELIVNIIAIPMFHASVAVAEGLQPTNHLIVVVVCIDCGDPSLKANTLILQPAVLNCRFMLSLRQPTQTTEHNAPFNTSANNHLTRFLNLEILRTLAITELGNIGEPVTNGPGLLKDSTEGLLLGEDTGDLRVRHEAADDTESSVRLSTVALSMSSEASAACHVFV